MTTEEKLKHIEDLQGVIRSYKDALNFITGDDNMNHYHHTGLIPKLLHLLGIKSGEEISYDYSHTVADEEFKGILVDFMEKKIKECEEEIESYFCEDGDFSSSDITNLG